MFAATAHGTPLAGPWTNAVGFGDGPLSNIGAGTLTVGNVAPPSNSAAQEMLSTAFPEITLANPGDRIVFSGNVTLAGTANSPADIGNPRNQFRFGLFNGDDDDVGWVGYYMSNKHGTSASGGVLAVKPTANTSTYLSTTGQTSLTTQTGDASASSLFHDGTYSFGMTIERVESDLKITSSLSGSNGFSQTMTATHTSAVSAGTFAFDRFGFLLGQNLGTDRAAFNNLDVAYIPAPETLTLQVLSSGPHAGTMRIVNSTENSINFSYYEVRSDAGSLSPTNWRSLDDQDPSSPPNGWGEAGGVSTKLLAEGRILGQTALASGAALSLGDAYLGPTNDLEFFVGAGGPLLQGEVEFVVSGDFNADGSVNGADLTRWKGGVSATGDAADADFDGDSDGADFLAWQRSVAPAAVAVATSVPEPATLLIGAVAACFAFGLQQSLGVRRRGRLIGR